MWQILFTHTPLLYLTQSFWRDEAYSVLAAKQSLSFIVTKLGFEPPVYYWLLHFFVRLFGDGDIGARIFSFIAFVGVTIVVIEWAAVLYKRHWMSIVLPALFFFNPMLLYYAFEVRAYAWYTLFSTLMLVSYMYRRWVWFTVFSILAFYTHTYALFFIGALGIHWFVTEKPWRQPIKSLLTRSDAVRSFFWIAIAGAPWIIRIIMESKRLASSWYFPVDGQLVLSALGNMFIGYEGTPWYGWKYTPILSGLILLAAGTAIANEKTRKQAILFSLFGGIPLFFVIAVSFLKPLYVNRYLIPTTVAEILLISIAITSISNKTMQKIIAFGAIAGSLWINWWFPPQHQKVPYRQTIREVNTIMTTNDVIYAEDALNYLETLYYANDKRRVYLYNPQRHPFAWYIGDALMDPSKMKTEFPLYPNRAFLIHQDATYDIVYTIPFGTQKQTKP